MKLRQKKFFISFLPFFVLLVCSNFTALAFQNEPDGFSGIKWGTNISQLTDMLVVESGKDTLFYCRKNENMKIGDADIDQISYGFYKSRFFQVLVEYKGYVNSTKLKAILIGQYGKPEQPNQLMEKYFWSGQTVDIYFDYNEMLKSGNIYYSFRPIQQEKVKQR
jgi:hypothetical protein